MSKPEIDNLITINKVDGAILSSRYGTYHITRKDIGLLKLNSGQIVVADPLLMYRSEDFARKALSITVRPGVYSVELYTASDEEDSFPAFSCIRFNNNTPVKFTAAKTIHDQEQKRKPPYRYVVEECRTGFMDAEVFHTSCKLPKRMCIDYLIDFDEDENEDTEFRCVVGSSEDGELTAALFTIMKSGVYYWYWGKDCNGEICCLFADFFTYQ